MWANWNCLSLFTSHVVITGRAEHTTSYRGRATTSFRSYHQLKTINLNLGLRCGKTEIVCHWSLLMCGDELEEHSIQLLTCHICRGRLCHRSQGDNISKSWKKVWPLFFLSLITSHAKSTSRVEHTTSYMSCKQMNTLSSFTTRQPIQILKRSVTSVFFCHWSLLMPLAPAEQSIQLLIGAEQQLLLDHTIN